MACSGLSLIAACSGGGGGPVASAPPPVATPSPAPAPAPTPSPSPAPFTPTAARIFEATPGATGELYVAGRAWAADYEPDLVSVTYRDAGPLGASYDPATNTYQLDLASFESGTLYQVAEARYIDHASYQGKTFYQGRVGSGPTATGEILLFVLQPGSANNPYSYLSLAMWTEGIVSADDRHTSYGIAGFAQQTAPGDVPLTGTGTYRGDVFGYMAGNSYDTIGGTARLDVDFASATLAGTLNLSLLCAWGCAHPTTEYQLTNGSFARGASEFAGTVAQGSATGQFAGTFAGPNAAEMLVRFETSYFNPEWQTPASVTGIILAGKD